MHPSSPCLSSALQQPVGVADIAFHPEVGHSLEGDHSSVGDHSSEEGRSYHPVDRNCSKVSTEFRVPQRVEPCHIESQKLCDGQLLIIGSGHTFAVGIVGHLADNILELTSFKLIDMKVSRIVQVGLCEHPIE